VMSMAIYSKIPEILMNLASAGQNGVFRAQKASVKKQLILKNGYIAFAESSLPEEHIARIMVSMGFLKQADLQKVISLMKTGRNSEEAVAAMDCSADDAVNKGMGEQVVAVVSSLLEWRDCEMRFYPGDNLIINRSNLGLNIPEILVLSARRAVSKRLVPVPSGFLNGAVVPNKEQTGQGPEFPLDETEKYAYVRAHDQISAAELIPLISALDVAPEEVLLRLYVLGLIEYEDSRGSSSGDTSESDTSETMIEDMLLSFETAGLYGILSIKTDAGPDEIQAAYHDLAKRFHPDRFQSGEFSDSLRNQLEKVFAYINKAYLTLKDPVLRAEYDETRLAAESSVESAIKSKVSSDADTEKMMETVFIQGRKALSRGDFAQAVKDLNNCVYMRPEKAAYNYYLGLAELEIPNLNKNAEQHLLKAIELESMSADSHLALAKLYLKVGLRRKASGVLDALMQWDPDNPKAKRLLDSIVQEVL